MKLNDEDPRKQLLGKNVLRTERTLVKKKEKIKRKE